MCNKCIIESKCEICGEFTKVLHFVDNQETCFTCFVPAYAKYIGDTDYIFISKHDPMLGE